MMRNKYNMCKLEFGSIVIVILSEFYGEDR